MTLVTSRAEVLEVGCCRVVQKGDGQTDISAWRLLAAFYDVHICHPPSLREDRERCTTLLMIRVVIVADPHYAVGDVNLSAAWRHPRIAFESHEDAGLLKAWRLP
jgi:hypothetical protein